MADGVIAMIKHFMAELGYPSVGMGFTRLTYVNPPHLNLPHAKRAYVHMVNEVLRVECHTAQGETSLFTQERHTDTVSRSNKHDIRDPDTRIDEIIALIVEWITTP